jgi:hypothetical protein
MKIISNNESKPYVWNPKSSNSFQMIFAFSLEQPVISQKKGENILSSKRKQNKNKGNGIAYAYRFALPSTPPSSSNS